MGSGDYGAASRRWPETLWRSGTTASFFEDLIRHTGNFRGLTWLGSPIWQNVLDLWTIQETIAEVRPSLILETGTNRGGSAFFYATLLDLLGGGRVVTADVEDLRDPSASHTRVTFLLGSSVSDAVMARMQAEAESVDGPVMVVLDSDHARDHVAAELEAYAPLVTPGSFLLCQDGVIDLLEVFAGGRPGPLSAIEEFLARHPEFAVDERRCGRFLATHHPKGWLRRLA